MMARVFVSLSRLGYLEFLNLNMNARLVLTDSGGLQEETTVLGVPCITLRHNTERPITVEEGTNVVVGNSKDRILAAASDVLEGSNSTGTGARKVGRESGRKNRNVACDECQVRGLHTSNHGLTRVAQ